MLIENEKKLKGYSGYLLDFNSKEKLKSFFPPKYPKTIAHHVTHAFNTYQTDIPNKPKSSYVVGYAEENGLEALVVEVNGSIYRPDGNIYHITWSLDPSKNKKPKDSNLLIQKKWYKVNPISINLIPNFFKFTK